MKYLNYPCLFTAIVFVIFITQSGCHHDSKVIPSRPDNGKTTLDAPLSLNIFPAITNTKGTGRLFIKTTFIGDKPVVLPLIFDTGSAGVTLNALNIFPASIVDGNGFKFDSGQDTLQYMGITITSLNVEKIFGSTSPIETKQIGNIGYATLSVGDEDGSVKMTKMPILFYYKTLANDVETTGGLGEIFGTNTDLNKTLLVADPTKTFPLVSPFKYLQYSGGLIAGYRLNAVSLEGCNINIKDNCVPKRLLTLGLTANDESGYAMNPLNQLTPQPTLIPQEGHAPYPDFSIFDPAIPNCTVATIAKGQKVKVLLDTGDPDVIINISQESLNTNNYPDIKLTTPSNTVFSYNLKNVNYNTTFNPKASRSNFGIHFFTSFSFLEDYQNGKIGLN